MRIAFVTFEYPPFLIGGAGIYASHITRELASMGNDVTVFTPLIGTNNQVEKIGDLKVCRIVLNDNLPFKALQFWIKLPKIIKEAELDKEFEIIHFNGVSYWYIKKKLSNAHHIITIHHLVKDARESIKPAFFSRIKGISGEIGFLLPSIENRCIKYADKIIADSEYTRNQIIKTYKISANKIEVIYCGIHINDYKLTKEDFEDLNIKFALPNKPIVLFVGRVDDARKGLKLLLNSFSEVIKTIDCLLLVVGSGNQDESRKLIKRLKLSKNVIFTGFVDEAILKKLYFLCDVYVCPSSLEGFGLTILEAMVAGKPVIANKVGSIPEILEDGINGILVNENIEEMSNAILTYIKNAKQADATGEINMGHAKKFSWKISAEKTFKLYGQ